MFNGVYSGKKVLVTGHTGFKGSWLTTWLLELGAEVVGFSKDIPTQPSLFEVLSLKKKITHRTGNVQNLQEVREVMDEECPDFVFHLAAQAIVSISYSNPAETVLTNTMGTLSILEALRLYDKPCMAIFITSDKCYENVEWVWGYRETDVLGGKDVYSGSKASAELLIKAYYSSFFSDNKSAVRIAIGRAGNVIGGGDWAKDRIITDVYTAWSQGLAAEIRSPNSTRPWQHVLEPLSGYLCLGMLLKQRPNFNGEAFNFGPRAEQNRTVLNLLEDLSHHWRFAPEKNAYIITNDALFNEAGLLKLNCDKALAYFGWEPTLNFDETVDFIGDWYGGFYGGSREMESLTCGQLAKYCSIARKGNKVWA